MDKHTKWQFYIAIGIVIVALAGFFIFDAVVGNRQIIDFNQKFNSAWILLGGEWRKIEISSWTDFDDDVIQVKSTDGLVYLTQYSNLVLIYGDE